MPPPVERIECEDCNGWTAYEKTSGSRPSAGPRPPKEIWHLLMCPTYIVNRILSEESSRRIREEQA